MTTLRFASNSTLVELAKLTKENKKFNQPYQKRTTTKKGFYLVKDEGIYLMNAFDTRSGNNNWVIYARGYNPKTTDRDLVWEKAHDVSPDDFAEFIPLSPKAIEILIEGGDLKVKLTETDITVTCTGKK
tara:strand:- start:493 stop:879 length:387 start_codon:yes stop_codon:yes gene_type:complete